MRKLTLLSTLLICGISLGAVSLDLGFSYGTRNLDDSDLKAIFGNGTVYCPEFSVNIFKGITLGLLYEAGFERDGELGIYSYPTQLKVGGFEGFLGYTLDLGRFHPFVRLGYGSYTYEQTITAAHLPASLTSFKETQSMVTFAGGLKVDLVAGLYLGGQLRFVPMKLTPVENEIDLSGLRIMGTLGYRFDFN